MQDYRSMDVWRKSHAIAQMIYEITAGFPEGQAVELAGQMRRAAMLVPASVVRAAVLEEAGEMLAALGTAAELEYYLLLSHDLELLDKPTYRRIDDAIGEIRQMLLQGLG